jgi:hypothetical protein
VERVKRVVVAEGVIQEAGAAECFRYRLDARAQTEGRRRLSHSSVAAALIWMLYPKRVDEQELTQDYHVGALGTGRPSSPRSAICRTLFMMGECDEPPAPSITFTVVTLGNTI